MNRTAILFTIFLCNVYLINLNAQLNSHLRKNKTAHISRFENSNSYKTDHRIHKSKTNRWLDINKAKSASRHILNKVTGIDAIPSSERSALIALYNSTDGDNWTNNSGWKTAPVDVDGFAMPGTENTWEGISVNADHVEDITLSSHNLVGTIPPELGNLPNLVTLYLSENNLSGTIPVEIGNLFNLEEIALNTNSLSGPIPVGLTDAGDLPALWGLDLSNNYFSGNIPPQLGNLGALIFLYLSNNELTGSVPAELGNLSNLAELDLFGNDIDGIINSGLANPGNLPNLEYLDLGNNDLTGTIPVTLGNLAALVELYLDDNKLTGNIPAELGNLGNLEKLGLSYNNLDGIIEPGLVNPGNLANLEYLVLEYNRLTGNLPTGIGNLASLRFLIANNNLLDGSIPSQIGNLNSLLILYLFSNQLSGNLPAELGNISSLIELDLCDNQLSGAIPAGMFDPGELPNLVYLDLSTNQLTGAIPPAIANLGSLELFAAVENQLDAIPQELGNINSLLELYLFDNKFTVIPAGMLEAGDFPNLEVIDLSLNEIDGTIPAAFENLASLEELYLFGNKFTGDIPGELMNLANLRDDCLDIRWNSVYTSNAPLRTFLDAKQDGGNWENTQTIAPTNLVPGGRRNSVSYIQWEPILYSADAGGYDIYYSAVSGGPYTYHGSVNGKTSRSYGCTGFSEHSSYYFVVKARTNAHNDNNNILISEYSNETFIADMNYSSYPEVVTNTGATIQEGRSFILNDLMLKASDEDAATYTLIYSITSLPQHGKIQKREALNKINNINEISFTQNDIANGKVQYMHYGDDSTNDSFSFIVKDIEGHSSSEEVFEITISGVNDPPVIDSLGTITLFEDTPDTLTVCQWYGEITDPDDADSCLSFIITCPENILQIDWIDDTTYILTPAKNYFGRSCLSVKVKDKCDSASTSVEVQILHVNDLPTLSGLPSSLSFMNGDVELINLNGTAEDVETPDSLLLWSFSSDPDSLNIVFNTAEKEVIISARGAFDGTAELTVSVTDEDGGSTSETITITVTPDPTSINGNNGLPTKFELSQNYPNPFNPSTTIRYGIPAVETRHAVSVQLRVYDILGNLVAILQDGQQSPGYYERTWNVSDRQAGTKNVSSGIYLYMLRCGEFTQCRKMILLK